MLNKKVIALSTKPVRSDKLNKHSAVIPIELCDRLQPLRETGNISFTFVCMANMERSKWASRVLGHLINEYQLEDYVSISSGCPFRKSVRNHMDETTMQRSKVTTFKSWGEQDKFKDVYKEDQINHLQKDLTRRSKKYGISLPENWQDRYARSLTSNDLRSTVIICLEAGQKGQTDKISKHTKALADFFFSSDPEQAENTKANIISFNEILGDPTFSKIDIWDYDQVYHSIKKIILPAIIRSASEYDLLNKAYSPSRQHGGYSQ